MSSKREDAIRESFKNQDVHFNYPKEFDEFHYLLGNFTQEKSDYVDDDGEKIGENLVVSWLIIMDDVSGLTDKSEDFSNFLTVSRKYGFSYLYVFHTIYPGRQSWEMIMSQTYIFNFFPGSKYSSRILKHFLFLQADKKIVTFPTNKYGWMNSIFKYQSLKKKSA